MSVFRRVLHGGMVRACGRDRLGVAVLPCFAPNFLTEFNIYVMLRSFCVALLVGFAQMVTLGVGQMNIAVGALGGLVAICFGGMMEVSACRSSSAVPLALVIGALGGLLNGLLTVRTGINGFIITLATASAFTGINLGITELIPFYKMPPALVAFGEERILVFPYLLIAPIIVAALLGLFFSRTVPGRQLLAYGGNAAGGRALRHFARAGGRGARTCSPGTSPPARRCSPWRSSARRSPRSARTGCCSRSLRRSSGGPR